MSVATLPDSLYNQSSRVVEGSVIWLICNVNATHTLSVTWNKDGVELVQDVPHVFIRRSLNSSNSTTLMLKIDNVMLSDAGIYQCIAQDRQEAAKGVIIPITGRLL